MRLVLWYYAMQVAYSWVRRMFSVFLRATAYAIARICYRPFVCLSVSL